MPEYVCQKCRVDCGSFSERPSRLPCVSRKLARRYSAGTIPTVKLAVPPCTPSHRDTILVAVTWFGVAPHQDVPSSKLQVTMYIGAGRS